MARGWASKAVESQQEQTQRSEAGETHRPLSEEERDRLQRRRTLELARARTAADFARASTPAQQVMLERALEALDAALRTLQS